MLTFQHLKRYTAIFCFAGVVSMPSLAGVHVDVNIGVGPRILWGASRSKALLPPSGMPTRSSQSELRSQALRFT